MPARLDSTPARVKRHGEVRLDRFAACFKGLDDPRTGNAGLHDFHARLIIALCAVLCGGQGAVDMAPYARTKEPFLREVLDLKNGASSHDTFSRLFRRLDADQFRTAFQLYVTGTLKPTLATNDCIPFGTATEGPPACCPGCEFSTVSLIDATRGMGCHLRHPENGA